ncbi:TRAP transporter substrate-binding protein [Scytonema millei]|uniref:TRAP transporter substrate-binding protein n=1 Tax=Scytonema millei VB511283 TaxID=1245923 RepID=A0A9X5E5Q9_9CYAN|nr:TRAP transporter substrate-binding protein [Scytonema millei]NHC35800.1 TRAP transporter substrate-binding protein [Scytonema millei VB511283]
MDRKGSIQRRNFLLGAAASATAAIAIGSQTHQTAKAQSAEFRWRMVSRWDKTFPDQLAAGQRLADRIAAMSGGRLVIEVLPPDTVVPSSEALKAVSNGTVEMSRSLAYDWRTQSPVLEFFFVVPYGFTQNEISVWLHYFGGQELWDAAYAPFGVKAFPAGSLGAQSFGWFRNEINTLNDLKGMRFRTTGVAADVISKLGVRPVSMDLEEIRQAMPAGKLDGFELVGPLVDLHYGLHKIAPYYYFPSYNQPSGLVELVVNREKYEALPTDLQQIVAIAAQAEHDQGFAEANAGNARALQTLSRDYNIQVRQLPPDVMKALGNASGEVIAEMRSRGDRLTKRTIDSFLSTRQVLMQWSQVTEQSFLTARTLPFTYG